MSEGQGGRTLFVDLRQTEQHQCTRNCPVRHVMGNMFECAASGQMHICDATCTQRVVYDNVSTICRLSRRVFPKTQQEMMSRTSSLGKRESGEFPKVENGNLKRANSLETHAAAAFGGGAAPPSPLAPYNHQQQPPAPMPFPPFPSPQQMQMPAPTSPFGGSPFAPAGSPFAPAGSPSAVAPQMFMVQ